MSKFSTAISSSASSSNSAASNLLWGGLRVTPHSKDEHRHFLASFKAGRLHQLRFDAYPGQPRPWAMAHSLSGFGYSLLDSDCATILKWARDVMCLTPSRRGRLAALQLGTETYALFTRKHRHRVADSTFQQLLALCECAGDLDFAADAFRERYSRATATQLAASTGAPTSSSRHNDKNGATVVSSQSCTWLLRVGYVSADDAMVEAVASELIDIIILTPTSKMQVLHVAPHDDINSKSGSSLALSTATMLHILRPRLRCDTELQHLIDSQLRQELLRQDGAPFTCDHLHLRFLRSALHCAARRESQIDGDVCRLTRSLLERADEQQQRLDREAAASPPHRFQYFTGATNWDYGHAPMCLASVAPDTESAISSAMLMDGPSLVSPLAAQSQCRLRTPHLSWSVQCPFPLVNSVLADSVSSALQSAALAGDIAKVVEIAASVPLSVQRDLDALALFGRANSGGVTNGVAGYRMQERDWMLRRNGDTHLAVSSATAELMHYLIFALCRGGGGNGSNTSSVGLAVQSLVNMLTSSDTATQPLDATLAVVACAAAKNGSEDIAVAICTHAAVVRRRRIRAQQQSQTQQQNEQGTSTSLLGVVETSVFVPPALRAYWDMDYPALFFETNAVPEFHFWAMLGAELGDADQLARLFKRHLDAVLVLEREDALDSDETVTSKSPIVAAVDKTKTSTSDSLDVDSSDEEIDINALVLHQPAFRVALQMTLFNKCCHGVADTVNDALTFVPSRVPVLDMACLSGAIAGWARYVPRRPLWSKMEHVDESVAQWVGGSNSRNSTIVILDASFIEASEHGIWALTNSNSNNDRESDNGIAAVLAPHCVLQSLDAVACDSESAPLDPESIKGEAEVRRRAAARLTQLAAAAGTSSKIEVVHFSEQMLAASTRPRTVNTKNNDESNKDGFLSPPLHSAMHDADSIIIDIARLVSRSQLCRRSQQQSSEGRGREAVRVAVATNDLNLIDRIQSVNRREGLVIGTMSSAPHDMLRSPEAVDDFEAKQESSGVVSVLQESLHAPRAAMSAATASNQQEDEAATPEPKSSLKQQQQRNGDASVGEWQMMIDLADEGEAEDDEDSYRESSPAAQAPDDDDANDATTTATSPRNNSDEVSFSVEFRGQADRHAIRRAQQQQLNGLDSEEQAKKQQEAVPSRLEFEERLARYNATRLSPFRPGRALTDESHINKPPTVGERTHMANQLSRRLGASVPATMQYRRYKANISDPRNALLVEEYHRVQARDAALRGGGSDDDAMLTVSDIKSKLAGFADAEVDHTNDDYSAKLPKRRRGLSETYFRR